MKTTVHSWLSAKGRIAIAVLTVIAAAGCGGPMYVVSIRVDESTADPVNSISEVLLADGFHVVSSGQDAVPGDSIHAGYAYYHKSLGDSLGNLLIAAIFYEIPSSGRASNLDVSVRNDPRHEYTDLVGSEVERLGNSLWAVLKDNPGAAKEQELFKHAEVPWRY